MKNIASIFKFSFSLIAAFIILLALSLFYIEKNPIYIENAKLQKLVNRYSPEYLLESEGGKISYSDGHIYLNIQKAVLKNKAGQAIELENLNHSFSIYSLKSVATATIVKSQLLDHIPIQSDNKIQEMVQEFNMLHQIKFNGSLEANFFFLQLENILVKLNSTDGIHQPKKKLEKIEIDKILVEMKLLKDSLEVEKLELKYKNNILASLNGVFTFRKDELIAAKFNTSVNNLPIDYLEGLWPRFLFPEIHSWVTQSIYGGIVTKAEASFDLNEKDFKSPDVVRKESVAAQIELNGSNLKFAEKFSPITKIDGIVKIDGHLLNFQSSKASYLASSINSTNLNLYFDKMNLVLDSKINGKINNFKEFIPEEVTHKLHNYAIEYKNISGNLRGDLNLTLPVNEEFNVKNLHLYVKANLENAILDKLSVIKLNNAILEISNEADKVHFILHHQGKTAFKLSKHHDDEQKYKDYAILDANIEVTEAFKAKNFHFDTGKIILSADADESGWETSFDLSDVEVNIAPFNYKKEKGKKFIIVCSGVQKDEEITSNDCKIQGKEASGNISFAYSLKDTEIKKLSINNGILGPNIFNFHMNNSNNFFLYNLTARYLDLSNFNFDDESNNQNFQTNFNVEKILLKNQTTLNKFNGFLKKVAHKPLEINLSGLSDSDKISFLKTIKNDQEFYSFYSTSAGLFSNAFGISKNIKKGNLLIEFTPTIKNKEVEYNGQIKAMNFYLTNTSILSKIILGILSPLNSPQAMAQSFQGGSLKADSFTAKINFADGVLTLKEGIIIGSSYKVKLEGKIDFNTKTVSFKGIYIPSFYGINTFISMLPLLGKLLAGGDKSAFIAASFSFGGPFDNIKTNFNPISILTPGFIRNIFN